MSRYALRRRDQTVLNSSQAKSIASNTMDSIVAQANAGISMDKIQHLTHNFIMGQTTPDRRLDAVMTSFEVASLGSEALGVIAVEAWGLLGQEKVWRGQFESAKEAKSTLDTPHLVAIRRAFSQGGQRKSRAISSIKSRWPNVIQDQQLMGLGEHHLEAISNVAEQYTYTEACPLLMKIRNRRLRRDLGGRSASRGVSTGDWKQLLLLRPMEREELIQEPALSTVECRKYNVTNNEQLMVIHAPNKASNDTRNQRRRHRNRARKTTLSQSISSNASSNQIRSSEAPAELQTEADDNEDLQFEVNGHSADTERDDADNIPEGDGDGIEETGTDDIEEDREEDSTDPDYTDSASQELGGEDKNSCRCINVPAALRNRLLRVNRLEAGTASDAARIDTIRQLIQANPERSDGLDHICYAHLKAVGGHCGLQTKLLKRSELQLRVQTVYRHRDDLNAFKIDPHNSTWFRLADRPSIPSDSLGIYSILARNPLRLTVVTDIHAAQLVEEISGSASAWSVWLETGNLIVSGLFTWIFDGISFGDQYEAGIGTLIEEEFLMYEHHQREINGKPNRGWLRTMIYSLVQQLVRQDLQYYLLYVAMRPDHNQRLVSYPYYTKFARPGDSTVFRHVDMNIPEFLETGRGGNIVQGSVSLDDETAETGCTAIVPGMHRRLGEWWSDVVQRSDQSQLKGVSGRVHNVKPLWHPDDAAKYGDWTPVPCRRGDVRITRPELVHGSTATTAIRRTILPWYVGVGEDGKSLDTAESGTWDDLCVAHIGQRAPFSSPSGHPNMYGAIPHRFTPATRLCLESAVSQALVCARPWDDPTVIREANVLLGPDRDRARLYIRRARMQALQVYKAAYEKQAAAERVCFGPESFYERRDRGELKFRRGAGGGGREDPFGGEDDGQ